MPWKFMVQQSKRSQYDPKNLLELPLKLKILFRYLEHNQVAQQLTIEYPN